MLGAASTGSPYAFPFAFAAGAVSSVGPCVAPRFVAIAGFGCSHPSRTALCFAGAFVAGLITAYAALGSAASLIPYVFRMSTAVYVALAVMLAAAAVAQLWREEGEQHLVCSKTRPVRNLGAAFFIGMSFALVVSPCCTPLVAGILTYTSMAGHPLYGSAVLVCFAVGHSLPLFAVAAAARQSAALLNRVAVRTAGRVMSAGLMLVLAAYYAVVS